MVATILIKNKENSISIKAIYQVQINLSVQTNCGGEVGGEICKSVIRSGRNYTFANPPSHLSPAVGLYGLHEEVGLH